MSYIDTMSAHNGRHLADDDAYVNIADEIRATPINIARGKMPGASPIGSFGERTSTGAESDFPVWPDGPLPPILLTGVQMSIQSTSANDSAAGTHVRVVEVHALVGDALLPYDEFVTLNGTTPVLTQATDIRWIQCMHIHEVGTETSAAGTISAQHAGNTYSEISVGKNRCASSFRMVPGGKRLYIDGAVGSSVSATADTQTRLRLVANELDQHQYNTPMILIPHAAVGLQNGSVAFTFPPGLSFSAGTIVGCTHTTSKAATITCSWFGRLEPV